MRRPTLLWPDPSMYEWAELSIKEFADPSIYKWAKLS
jgi:hypothetical protein